METIIPPVVTSMIERVSDFYNLIKITNPKADEKAIFDFIEENEDICNESVVAFQTNLRKNLKLMTFSSVLSGKSKEEIEERIEKMQFYENLITLQNELKKFTIKDT